MTELLPIDNRHRRAKLSASDFELLSRHGAFAAYRKTELIDGSIFFMNAQFRPHGYAKTELYDAIRDALRSINSPFRPMCEVTLALTDIDRPEPDILLTSEPDGDGFVPLASVPLVIEVSDTTLALDLGRKRRRYAGAGVPEYWVADINGRTIHQLWGSTGDRFADSRAIPFGDVVVSTTIAGLVITTDGL